MGVGAVPTAAASARERSAQYFTLDGEEKDRGGVGGADGAGDLGGTLRRKDSEYTVSSISTSISTQGTSLVTARALAR